DRRAPRHRAHHAGCARRARAQRQWHGGPCASPHAASRAHHHERALQSRLGRGRLAASSLRRHPRENAGMRAEIIAVGSELLTPDRTDTNSLFLTDRLNRLGIEVSRKTIVGDQLADLRDAFDGALSRVELVIASGGLGPTLDDLTREALADLLG